jgi:large subunit ribosomal protein L13
METKWWLVDADNQILGRLASKIATILRGKNKPGFAPNVDAGDYVICINAEKVKVTGNKERNKLYTRYSGYPSGLKKIPLGVMREKHPENLIYHAVKGMLPKNTLGRGMLKKLKVYCGNSHPHEAQKPVKITL